MITPEELSLLRAVVDAARGIRLGYVRLGTGDELAVIHGGDRMESAIRALDAYQPPVVLDGVYWRVIQLGTSGVVWFASELVDADGKPDESMWDRLPGTGIFDPLSSQYATRKAAESAAHSTGLPQYRTPLSPAQAERRPLPPGELVEALQDRVHEIIEKNCPECRGYGQVNLIEIGRPHWVQCAVCRPARARKVRDGE